MYPNGESLMLAGDGKTQAWHSNGPLSIIGVSDVPCMYSSCHCHRQNKSYAAFVAESLTT